MEIYLDILPKELLNLILYNFYDPIDFKLLNEFELFRAVTSDPKFWNGKVKHDFLDIDFDIIPDYLYKFKESDSFWIYIANYRRLYQAYKLNKVNFKTFINYKGQLMTMTFTHINNIKSLYLSEQKNLEKVGVDKILELYESKLYYGNVTGDIIELTVVFKGDDIFAIEIEHQEGIIKYTITPKQAYNLLLHACINGWTY